MHRTLLVVSTLALVGLASAQTTNPTSPAGFATTEGNTSFNHFSVTTSSNARRFQQIDNTLSGNSYVIRGLGFRRDGGTNGGGTNEPPAR